MNRRDFLKAGTLAAGSLALLGCSKTIIAIEDDYTIDNGVFDPFIPDYYFENGYLDGKIARIKTLLSKEGVTQAFVFITDQHWEHNAQNSISLLWYVQQKTKLSRMFCGGDIADLFGTSGFAYVRTLRKAWGGEIHCVVGNHEYLGSTDATEQMVEKLFKTNPEIQVGNHVRHYYYVDDPVSKTRYIILSSYSQSVDGGKHALFGYGEEQERWLRDVALDVESGWKIYLFTHLLFFIGVQDDKITICDESIADILDNYSDLGRGKIMAVFHGHNHRDRVIYTPKSKIPVIVTTCDKYRILGDDQQNVVRTPGTIDEQAFDVVIVNEQEKKIHCVRIGCPAKDGIGDNIGDDVEERIIDLY